MENNKSIINYLETYKNISFEACPFNEVDALVLAELAYFPFNKINIYKDHHIEKEDVITLLNSGILRQSSQRKIKDQKLCRLVVESARFKDMQIHNFVKDKSMEKEQQFQAVTFDFKDFMVIAFAGTDASIIGWKEDLNLSFQEQIPSDIRAVEYVMETISLLKKKPLYLVGHSKGGRLAIYSAKQIAIYKYLTGVYSFDGPGFEESFYDEQYLTIVNRIQKIIPEASIIGKLFHSDETKIICSLSKSIMQHDCYNWIIEADHFVESKDPKKHNFKIANAINNAMENFTDEEKYIAVDVLYELMNELNIKEFGNKDYNKELLKFAIKNFPRAMSKIEPERKKIFKSFLTSMVAQVLKEYLPKKK